MLHPGLDQPYGQLITSGCDQRLIVGADGLNTYGTSVLTRRAFALGSCSCSSPSERATRAARQALDQLRGSSNLARTCAGLRSRVHQTLQQSFQLPASVDIALTPSGTDLEMLAAALVAGPGDRELVNIIVGRGEVGSGTCDAAAIRHYNTRLPRGGKSVVGQIINEALAARVTTKVVDLRDRRGDMLLPVEVDGEVLDIIMESVDQGSRVLVHHVAHSKTGIHAPSLSLLDRVSRTLGDDVAVIVDAAQGRLTTAAYYQAVSRGWLVSLTGSKFFGGPPFSGSLLVPRRFGPAVTGWQGLPDGFADYFSRDDLPVSWPAGQTAEPWTNIGLLLRWAGAAAEIESFFDVDPEIRERIATAFAAAIGEAFSDRAGVTLLPSFTRQDHDSAFDEICGSPTVFSLLLTGSGGAALGRGELKQLHRRLNKVSAGSGFHLGQPVDIGEDRCVIRVALGAPLMTDIANNRCFGETLPERIAALQQLIHRLGDRIQASVTQIEFVPAL